MNGPRVTLIGFQDQDNLGLGYLAAMLESHNIRTSILDFRQGGPAVLESVLADEPVIVGFSLIFQYYLREVAYLAAYLREHGVKSHFCIGGHYPTVCFRETLAAVPEIDSVVCCEGEQTITELAGHIAGRKDWHEVQGIAYREGNQCITTSPRPLIADLDKLPYPLRPVMPVKIVGKRCASILASRGCSRACSFCSIRQFYNKAPGKKVRVRQPASVVQEMKFLHQEHDVSIFLFQDDDFPVYGEWGKRWVKCFLENLRASGLADHVLWKISCRADEIDRELFRCMRDAGMYMVYLGLESGTEEGLAVLNKRITIADSLRAAGILQELDLIFAFGFMLFDPSSTFQSVRENVAFLRKILGGGGTAVSFGRMLPYAGTPIEDQLAHEGRLRGGVNSPEYSFLDVCLDLYFELLNSVLTGWIQGPESLANMINSAWQEYVVLKKLFSAVRGMENYEQNLRTITKRCNERVLMLVEESCCAYEKQNSWLPDRDRLQLALHGFKDEVINLRDAFIMDNREVVLKTFRSQHHVESRA